MEKLVFSAYEANYLVQQGFKIIGTRLNFKNPKYLVYVFEDSPELQNAIEAYQQAKRN